jgi:glycyl-tRNA synthetase beta chain
LILELLFEIGTEELPPLYVEPALEDLKSGVVGSLKDLEIEFSEIKTLGTPRRLVLIIKGLAEKGSDVSETVFGPPVSAAYDGEGRPTKAALGFAKSQGVEVSELKTAKKDKGDYVCIEKVREGAPTLGNMGTIFQFELNTAKGGGIRFPKTMRWEEEGQRFARPIRWMTYVVDGVGRPFTWAGIEAGNMTRGHRFLGIQRIEVTSIDRYIEDLRANFVVVDHEERRSLIRKLIEAAAASIGGRVVDDDDLLRRVTFTVEYPLAVAGAFSPDYLQMPKEVVVTALKEHQDFFSVCDADGNLMPYFIAVANIDEDRSGKIKGGNERVLKARLDDAHFYWKEDLRDGLDVMAERLAHVVWQEQLGTLAEKTERVGRLAERLVDGTGLSDKGRVRRGARLAKADLTSQMVREKEFSSLQGLMGREYARASDEDPEVAEGIFEHYMPRFAGDRLPDTDTGTVLALADKLDTLVGCFGVGLMPTGSADPFALRRQAIGFARILMEKSIHVSLKELIALSHEFYASSLAAAESAAEKATVEFMSADALEHQLLGFIGQRVETLLVDRGERRDLVESVIDVGIDDPALLTKRLAAVKEFEQDDRFSRLVTAFKRAYNIKKGEMGAGVDTDLLRDADIDSDLLEEPAEKNLYKTCQDITEKFNKLIEEQKFTEALALLLELSAPVDVFFDQVMVMVEDKNIKRNRLNLLGLVIHPFLSIANLSKLEVG